MVVLMVLLGVLAAQILLRHRRVWQHRVAFTADWLALHTVTLAVFMYSAQTAWSLMLLVPFVYQCIHYWRIVAQRMQSDHLRRSTQRTTLWLTGLEAVLAIGVALHEQLPLQTITLAAALIVGALYSILLIWGTRHHLLHTRSITATPHFTDAELPSISVLLPARNETEDLQRCLETLTSSTYPKLEIIVLDDCSQNKHTPQIIKDFAQAGVRFLAGTEPPISWLPKNYAYQQLVEAANGDYLVFCDVDARLQPAALREVIGTMLEKNKTMLSVLPKNSLPTDARSYILQPLRYAWELCLPRRLVRRPAVLSSLWAIKKQTLMAAGSFKATSRSMTPESYLAKFAARTDGYSFVRSTAVRSSTTLDDQIRSARRLRYPQLHRRPEVALFISSIAILCSVGMVALLVFGVIQASLVLITAAVVIYAATLFAYTGVSAVMYGRVHPLAPLLAPAALIVDVIMIHRSMFAYEFGEVSWKDRNICLPVMRIDAPTAQYSESKS